jgi:hypothetical protein
MVEKIRKQKTNTNWPDAIRFFGAAFPQTFVVDNRFAVQLNRTALRWERQRAGAAPRRPAFRWPGSPR